MDQPPLVRIATPEDIEGLFFHLLNEYGAENSVPVPISPVAVFETVKACCNGDHAIAGVMESRKNGIVASIGLRAVVPWFSKQDIINQIWLFVAPHARGRPGLHGHLFDFMEWHRQDISAKLGYDVICENSVLSLDRLPAKTRLWRRYGQQIGSVFWAGGALNEQDKHKNPDHDPGESGGHERLHRPRK